MRINSLSLQGFRNFTNVEEIVFPEAPLLVAAAPNATGKTNFLESIYFLLRGKSFRASAEECVSFDMEGFSLRGEVAHNDEVSELIVRYEKATKRIRIEEDSLPVSPVVFYSHYPLVLFLPDDTFLFSRGPALRRNFLNTVLTGTPAYLSGLVQYHRVLKQRNSALRQAKQISDVAAWTDLLNTYATAVWGSRTALVDFLQTHVSEIYKELTNEDYHFKISLNYGAPDPDTLLKSLTEAWSQEVRYQHTIYGPHRDDVEVLLNGRSVQAVLSRGQMRALIIALKVGAYRFIKQTTEQDPLFLFDEVLSELDEDRQRILLEHLPGSQIVLTCTSLPSELKRREDVHVLDLRSILREEENVPAPTEVVVEVKAVATV